MQKQAKITRSRRGNSLHHSVAQDIGARILKGEFAPGTLLPNEAEWCKAYGVSRTAVREAIKMLAAKGLIVSRPKIGSRVQPRDAWNLLDRDVLGWRLLAQFDTKIVEDIFEMRLCFEPRASALAAAHGSDEDFRMLQRRYDELADALQAGRDVRGAAAADLEFHLTLINMSRNGMFITIGGAIKAALRTSSEMLHSHPDHPLRDLSLYREVLERVLARDTAASAEAMTALVQASRDRLLGMMKGWARPAP